MSDDDEKPTPRERLLHFTRWRRDSGAWAYSTLLWSWTVLTVLIADATDWGWRFFVGGIAVFALLFEVGLAYVITAAWGSHRQLEREGEIAELVLRLQVDELGPEERDEILKKLAELGQPVDLVEEE